MFKPKKVQCLRKQKSVLMAAGTAYAVVVDTSIDHVVVFRDRAEVTRTGRIDLDAGDHNLEFKRLVGGMEI